MNGQLDDDHGRTPDRLMCLEEKTSVDDRLPSSLLAYAWFALS